MHGRSGVYGMLTAVVMTSVGCTQDLGVCDMEAAKQVYFDRGQGTAMYAGQALLVRDCQSCHSPGSPAVSRQGAPAGLDFAVAPISGAEDATRLAEQWRQTHRLRHQVFFEVEKKFMPPPGSTSDVAFETSAGAPLPAIHSDDGVQAVKNWLACGAPVVGLSVAPSDDTNPGDLCTAATSFGDCRIGREEVEVQRTWSDIYSKIFPTCKTCHSGTERVGVLDFSDLETAYVTLLGGGDGADAGRPISLGCSRPTTKLVKPFDPEGSVLWQSLAKGLDPNLEYCALPMMGPTQNQLDRIRDWISNGAPMN